jgi:hypothetical protein
MASGDSRNRDGFRMIHGLCDLGDLDEAVHGELEAHRHHPNDRRKLLELIGLGRSQWIRFEERNDRVEEIGQPEDLIDEEVFLVSFVPWSAVDPSASEVVPDRLKDVHAPLSLHDHEGWLELPPVADSSVPLDGTAEAASSVDEADDPVLDPWPFLLIARTRRIFTGHAPTIPRGSDMTGTAGYSGVPAYSQLHSTPSPA